MSDRIEQYWQQYLESLPPDADHPDGYYESFSFGTSPQEADRVLPLVLAGIKTSTGSLKWAYDAQNRRIPQRGDLSIVTDGNRNPSCIIETTEVRTIPFNEVDEAFAYDGGEGDRTLNSWRRMYQAYLQEECRKIGKEFTPKVRACAKSDERIKKTLLCKIGVETTIKSEEGQYGVYASQL